MYYKKRPELMKLVEEFYRAYRALAERYDNATGVLRQAHRTMAEAFPNQVPDSKGLNERASKAEAEVQTLKEALTKLDAEREASFLQYQQCLDKITNLENNISHAQKDAGELNERATKAEIEAQSLMRELAKLKAEKEDTFLQFKQCLEKISDLEGKLLHAEEDSRRYNEHADKAEREVETLKEVLAKLTEEKEAAAVQ
ncbi:hypothetical protein GH714_025488 [Hevea brasiliensis]|uniref:NAB domain-containing protein n=1 Tax=Hevea brasiliensis TaxID=3981 RepID=A0A6A6NK68_HEVBR|nr:hypothetical protein GH714_025488 [Hevea brasiliensis]